MKIYQTFRNSDMAEGRGPMVPDLAFATKKVADSYIDQQFGVMGRTAKWSQENYGDWCVKEVIVYDSIPDENSAFNDKIRSEALSKLTKIEKAVLGLDKTP